jgi:hypothetical protein
MCEGGEASSLRWLSAFDDPSACLYCKQYAHSLEVDDPLLAGDRHPGLVVHVLDTVLWRGHTAEARRIMLGIWNKSPATARALCAPGGHVGRYSDWRWTGLAPGTLPWQSHILCGAWGWAVWHGQSRPTPPPAKPPPPVESPSRWTTGDTVVLALVVLIVAWWFA